MPGAGGTQRISRLVGLARALDWVLRGRIVPPRSLCSSDSSMRSSTTPQPERWS